MNSSENWASNLLLFYLLRTNRARAVEYLLTIRWFNSVLFSFFFFYISVSLCKFQKLSKNLTNCTENRFGIEMKEKKIK